MFFLNSRIIAGSNGQYGERADQNLAELRAIMKGLIIRERKQSTQAEAEVSSNAAPLTTWSSSSKKSDASTQTGGRIWAHSQTRKKGPQVKTFSL
jgi:hypothetical protein